MRPQLVFLVGAPRSGTTWLQDLLGQHPAIATPQETDLFSRYIAPLDRRWRQQLDEGAGGSRRKGLPAVLTSAQFADALRGVVDVTVGAVLAMKPSATVVLEKSPSHSLVVPLIEQYEPDARFIHIVRDGRDVAASLVAASRGWGRGWAPSNVADAGRLWARSVAGARQAQRCHEVRYEDLRGTGSPVLREALAWCGVETTLDEAESYLATADLDRRRASGSRPPSILVGGELARERTGSEPEGFFGSAGNRRWDDWSASERHAFDRSAGQLLIELGYEPDRRWVGRRPVVPSTAGIRRQVARGLRRAAAVAAEAADPG